ncbi:MAG: dihydrofolate reductase [Candidatus Thorarchaeota archaeon]|nr:dihydrofolate reductase [Candidatus Thorarchaeota archaeon]
MANYVYIATSLDGFIAASDGGLDWLEKIPNPEGSDFGYADFMSGIDAIVMGRKTFDKVLTFGSWPYDKPVYVLSKSKVNIPKELENKVKIVNGDLKKLVDQLKEVGHQNLYIDGGITIQGFLEEDLIDEMIITRVPVLLGNGLPLFGKLTRRLYFRHTRTEIFNETLIKSHYTRVRV